MLHETAPGLAQVKRFHTLGASTGTGTSTSTGTVGGGGEMREEEGEYERRRINLTLLFGKLGDPCILPRDPPYGPS